MKKFVFLIILTAITCCKNDKKSSHLFINPENPASVAPLVKINKEKNTIKERFSAPKNYKWQEERPDSFGYFIEHFQLKPYGSKILKYNGAEIATQNLHEAIFNIDTGNKDLQQCADE